MYILPTQKRFRRRTRLEVATVKIEALTKILARSVKSMAGLAKALQVLGKGENWAVRERDDAQLVKKWYEWVGEGDPSEIVQKALGLLTPNPKSEPEGLSEQASENDPNITQVPTT